MNTLQQNFNGPTFLGDVLEALISAACQSPYPSHPFPLPSAPLPSHPPKNSRGKGFNGGRGKILRGWGGKILGSTRGQRISSQCHSDFMYILFDFLEFLLNQKEEITSFTTLFMLSKLSYYLSIYLYNLSHLSSIYLSRLSIYLYIFLFIYLLIYLFIP